MGCSDASPSSSADAKLESLLVALEDAEQRVQLPGYDVQCSSGVLTLRLGQLGTYVINKQPASSQIWLSSPVSGPKRFDFVDGNWLSKDESSLDALLQAELQSSLKIPITFK